MIYEEVTSGSRTRRTLTGAARVLLELRIDGPLVVGLSLIAVYGLVVLYSASGQSLPTVRGTIARLLLGAITMLLLARINPNFLRRSTPWVYAAGCVLAEPRALPLPALRAHEARGADDVRLVPA